MKKTKVSILTCATIIVASTFSFATTGTVNTDTARIRSEASSDSSIVDLLSIDDKVEVLENSGDWYKVKTGEKTGYISKSLLDVEGEVTTNKEENNQAPAVETTATTETTTEENTETTQNPTEPESTTETEEKIKEGFSGKLSSEVTVKILPSINSTDIAKIEKDTDIKVIEVINDWCHLETSTYSGWARISVIENALQVTSEVIQVEDKTEDVPDSEEQPSQEPEKKKGFVSVETVNLRAEANTSSEKLDSISKNTEVTILADAGDWYKVSVNNLTGYIAKQYISDKKVEEVTSRASDSARQIKETKNEEEDTTEVVSHSSSSGTGAEVVAFAKQYLGYSYVHGGSNPSTGFDCSGFTSYVYKNFGVSLDRTSSGQRNDGVAVSKSDLEKGDIVCFSGHVGIYIGDNEFIHASNPTGGVKITSLSDSYYVKNYITARRVLE